MLIIIILNYNIVLMNRFKLRFKVCSRISNGDNALVTYTIISLILAIIVAVSMQNVSLNVKQIYYISLPGIVFMNLMKMMILPLLILSLISGLTSLNLSTGRKQGAYAILYFLITTFIAVWLGIAIVFIIQPGRWNMDYNFTLEEHGKIDAFNSIADLFSNIFPDNIIRSTFQQSKIEFVNKTFVYYINRTTSNYYAIKTKETFSNGPNFLGLIFISIFFGVVLNYLGARGQILVTIITVLNNLTMKMVTVILWYMPVGVFFLVLSKLLSANVNKSLSIMIYFILTVLLGLMLHMFLVLPLIYLIIVRKNPFNVIKSMSRAMIVGFVTQSSSATMPVTIKCAEENLKIDKRVTKFMIPIGAIVNMDGTGLFEAVSAIFIAQISLKGLMFTDVIVISLTSTLAAIGAATLPSGGLVTLMIVLSTSGLDTAYVGLLYSCDWFLDRVRTAVNILGDAFGCGIIQHLCKEELENDININDHFMTNL